MKYFLILLAIISFGSCKKDRAEVYMINKTEWKYAIPENYIFIHNNSVNSRAKKNNYPLENPEDMSKELFHLLTARKKLENSSKKWSDSNFVMATYTNADFVRKYGSLKKYLNKSKVFLDKSYSREINKPEILNSEEKIGERIFDVQTQKFTKFQNKYTYTSITYYIIIENNLFEFSVWSNNGDDQKELLESFRKSKFNI